MAAKIQLQKFATKVFHDLQSMTIPKIYNSLYPQEGRKMRAKSARGPRTIIWYWNFHHLNGYSCWMGKNAQLDVPEWRVMYYSGEATGVGGGGGGLGRTWPPPPQIPLTWTKWTKENLCPPRKSKAPCLPDPLEKFYLHHWIKDWRTQWH